MNNTLHYHPTPYDHVGYGELYIDHRHKDTWWSKLKAQLRQGGELMDARFKTIFNKNLQSSQHTKAIRKRLREVGLSGLDLLRSETFSVAKMIHKDEEILGAMMGSLDEGGFALLVVTNLRVIYLNQIPLFTKLDEVGFAIVTGVSSKGGQWDRSVTLHTGMGDFTLYGVSPKASEIFVEAIERVAIDKRT